MSETPFTETEDNTFIVPVPVWIDAAVGCWTDRLGVGEYAVRMHMSAGLEDSDDMRVLGSAIVQARYLRAAVTFSTRLEDNAEGQHVVAHEVGHILLGEIDAIAQHLIDQLPARAQGLAFEMWDDVSERTIERLTRALGRSHRRDTPDPSAA